MQDSILFWNAVAIEANRVSHSDPDKRQQNGPTLSSRAIAIVHLAMYDAYAKIVNLADFPPYVPGPMGPPGDPRDGVAGAAHRTLSRLYSAQTEYFDAQLSGFDTTNTRFAFGQMVGQALLNLRANDMDGRDCGTPSPNVQASPRPDIRPWTQLALMARRLTSPSKRSTPEPARRSEKDGTKFR